jgi:hypothetical protein
VSANILSERRKREKLAFGERLSLLHIDWHTDTLYSRIDTWLKECPDLEGISIDDYLTHSHKTEMGDTPLFRWDNYLSIFLEKYGPQIDRRYFATHGVGDLPRLRDGRLSPQKT